MRERFLMGRFTTTGRSKTMIAIGAAIAAQVISGGVAFAYFKGGHATGTGTATAGSPQTVTISASTASRDLFPGKTGSVWFTLHNGNSTQTNFTSVTTATVTSSSDPTNCPTSNLIVTPLPYTISPTISVAGNATTGATKISGLLTMSSSAPNQCQGVSFSVTLTLAGASS